MEKINLYVFRYKTLQKRDILQRFEWGFVGAGLFVRKFFFTTEFPEITESDTAWLRRRSVPQQGRTAWSFWRDTQHTEEGAEVPVI